MENSQQPIVFLGTITAARGTDVSENTLDLLAIKEDGEIQCFDGDSLEEKWTSPSSALGRDSATSITNSKVEFAHITNAHAASQGILKGRQDVFALFTQEISEEGFNPEILVIITKSSEVPLVRTLHIVSLPRRSAANLNSLKHSVEPLLSANLPSQDAALLTNKTSFSIQPSMGIIQQLTGNVLHTFDLSDTLPKEQSKLKCVGAQSFLRISSTSIMVSSEKSITVYNPRYHSVLAKVDFAVAATTESLKRKRDADEGTNGTTHYSCNFVAYFPKLGAAVAILDHNLVSVQVEGQQDRHGKPRATGLLTDSLGGSTKEQLRPGRSGKAKTKDNKLAGLKSMPTYAPGSIGAPDAAWAEQISEVESVLLEGNASQFDELISVKIGLKGDKDVAQVNGISPNTNRNKGNRPPQSSSDVDPRWIFYTLSKIFTLSEEDSGEQQLSISFYPPTVFTWLLRAGNVTVTNIEKALGATSFSTIKSVPAGELVNALVEMDPDMDLLLGLLTKTSLSAPELLHAIRKLMDSLGLFGDEASTKHALLTNGEELVADADDIEEQVKALEADAEKALELAEYQLGPGSGVRGEALSLALSKLYTHDDTVRALQTTFQTHEIVSLIYLLRFELARGAWTSRYLDDGEQSDIIDERADIPDNAIILISSLLTNCVDAIGAGGWLSGDARLVNGDPFEAEELIASLKLEVSAALEGIEEAEYLKGLTSEMIRYGDSVLKALPYNPKHNAQDSSSETPAQKRRKPVVLPSVNGDDKILPLGLKAEQLISKFRVGAGGEVQKRTMRDIGHLKSKQVGKYSLERIIV
jgi:hypothetical protein